MATAKTETPKSQIIDIATGEITEFILSAEELAEREQQVAEVAARQAAEAAKAAARQSALAKLAELGLTEEEIAAL